MTRAALLPAGVSHGEIVVSVCAGVTRSGKFSFRCGNSCATYGGVLPSGWSVVAGKRFCRTCTRKAKRARSSQ